MPGSQLLFGLCFTLIKVVVLTRHPVQASSDEFLPKRLDKQTDKHTGLFTSPDRSFSAAKIKPITYPPGSAPCSAVCFLKPPNFEIVHCAKRINDLDEATRTEIKMIKCQQHRNRGEIILGNKESVRGIEPGTLENLLAPDEDLLTRSGQFSIYLNLNMVRFDARLFQGLGTVITEVRLFNTVQMHPDSLIELQHLRAFEIDTGLTPLLLASEDSGEPETGSTLKDSQMYVRILPADTGMPIMFNLETSCHQCISDLNSTNSSYVIVAFTIPRKSTSSSNHLKQPGFSMIFPQTCPRLVGKFGCVGNLTDIEEISVKTDVSTNDDKLMDNKSSKLIIQEASTPSLLILLSIWCTVLTIVIVLIICIVYFCTKRLAGPKLPPKWFPIICAQQQSSLEDISSNSTNSAYCNNLLASDKRESTALSSVLMNESRGSWHSLRIGHTPHSRSAHSLKDRSLRGNNGYPGGTLKSRRIRKPVPIRRSIGSQTDFTDIDSEMFLYASLRRNGRMPMEPFAPEPPTRTTSQYALSRMRHLNRMDAIYQRYDKSNRFSAHFINPPTFLDNVYPTRYRGRASNVVPAPETIDPGEMRANNNKLTSHPTVYDLPPIPPTNTHTAGHRSPTPWKNTIVNGPPVLS
ncbi:hypothetical protein EG68_00884 [Paragonimus skrjabini miyazakii]|uniref:Uncharacterized protein n=1 Tax=Paragonimus skrjabini miyazakii TaxID=59628 RepID=A0A8S9Z9B0_9TREM|nr:hypothetical protein EG68_00884 [Paragonimus skrjabini miyazakii]